MQSTVPFLDLPHRMPPATFRVGVGLLQLLKLAHNPRNALKYKEGAKRYCVHICGDQNCSPMLTPTSWFTVAHVVWLS